MNIQISSGLAYRDSPLTHQLYCFNLELPTEPPSRTHAAPPIPKEHLKMVSTEPGTAQSVAVIFARYYHATRTKGHPKYLSLELRKRAFVDEVNEKLTGAIDGRKRYGWIFYFSELNDFRLLHLADAIIAGYFRRLTDFSGHAPPTLKRMVRAYYEGKYEPTGGYIHNYNSYVAPVQRLEFLVRNGIVDMATGRGWTGEMIDRRFEVEKRRRLAGLEKDVGHLY